MKKTIFLLILLQFTLGINGCFLLESQEFDRKKAVATGREGLNIQKIRENYESRPFFEDFDRIDPEVWHVAGWKEHGGQTSPERCYVDRGKMNMVFINDSREGNLSAAIQTRKEYLYGTWEARLKPSSVPGVLNSFYTIDWDNTNEPASYSDGTKQEIDIEFLTYTFGKNSGKVHFAVHAAGKKSFATKPAVSLDFNPSKEFHTWGFEISEDFIRWFVDGHTLETYFYEDGDISITAPYSLKLNVWSKQNWIKGPPEADVECVYQIDWIRFTPHEE